MKIAFWSNEYEKSCAFYNFAAVSIASVMQNPYTITVLENYLGRDNIGRAYFDHEDYNSIKHGGTYYEGRGIEGLLRRLSSGCNFPEILGYYSKEVIPNHLFYIPQNMTINSEIFDYELHINLSKLLNLIEENNNLCYINLNKKNHLSSKTCLQEVDLIVINLWQNSDYLNDFFRNYSSLLSKAIFILGNYSPRSFMSCKRISRLYDIPLEDIAPIPFNDEFSIACNQGRAKEFINSNYMCSKENPNFLFIHGIRKAAYSILKKVHSFDKKGKEHCFI
ncbi:MAG: hypothetical protein GX237_09005 [Clostridiales bacterium]|nr:hypothetical protein [Clostridiales bacterium]